MDAILYYDTEDSISPPAAGCDDIVLWLADLMTAHGIKGCFHVIGDKARTLERRGRRDVIDAVKRHDVSSHYDHGSVHPMTVELVDKAEWHDGVRAALEAERPGFAEIERIFGKCSGLTRHGSSYAPQIAHAAGVCGKVFHGVPFAMPGHRIFWFCGTLCTCQIGLIRVRADRPTVGKFEEDIFADTPRFEDQLRRFVPVLEQTVRQWDFTAMFGCHPLRLCLTRFCDNYVGGQNADPIRLPPVRSDEQKQLIKANFTRFIQTLSRVDGLRFVGLDDLAVRYGHAPAHITRGALEQYAATVRDDAGVPLHEWHSPAELLTGLALSLVGWRRDGELPAHVPAMKVLGPASLTPCAADTLTLSVDAMVSMAEQLIGHVRSEGMLPASLGQHGRTIAPAQLLAALADVYGRLAAGDEPQPTATVARALYPAIGDEVDPAVLSLAKWRILSPTVTFERIAYHTRCQTWSLKPAHASA